MLKKEEWFGPLRRPYPPLFCSLVCLGYPNEKYYKGLLKKPFSIKNMAHVDNAWYYGKAELEEGGNLALESWQDPKLFEYIKGEFRKREDNLVESGKRSFEDFCKAYEEYMPTLALVYVIDKPVEIALRKALSKKISQKEVDELMGKLNIPLQDNTHKQEEYDLVTSTNLAEHVKKYEWLYARYGEKRVYTIEEAQEKLKEINKSEFLKKWKEDKLEIEKAIKYAKELVGKEAYLVDIFQYIIYYRTHRTDTMNKAAFFAIPLFNKTAAEYGITYEQLMHCTSFEVLQKQIPSKEILNQRIKDCSLLLDNGKVSCLTGKESLKLIEFFKEEVVNVKEFKGQVACKGNVKGEVKVVRNKQDFEKIVNGDILVTSMTTPEMMPLLKKASAFVTDEGGLTCHAAIISREMNKPCIIGTKIATKVLKDGDMVEVDADKGIVRKI